MFEEIDSFAVFRYPETEEIRIVTGKFKHGLNNGFVIAPFLEPGKNLGTITNCTGSTWQIIKQFSESIIPNSPSNCNSLFNSTERVEHRRAVETIVKELDKNENKKTITCRIISDKNEIDLKRTFLNLAENLPKSFVFLFFTPQSGCWLGASPEILLTAENNTISTYALAGTRKRNEIEPWDSKNIQEHRIVFDYIVESFRRAGLNPESTTLSTRAAGNIEHLFQEIYADFDSDNIPDFSLIEFLDSFSPTPALCGMPKDESIDRIKKVEKFNREYYGGFCGWYSGSSDFAFYVMLRCMKIGKIGWNYYSGSGITCHSNADTEWIETELKSKSILDNIKYRDSFSHCMSGDL